MESFKIPLYSVIFNRGCCGTPENCSLGSHFIVKYLAAAYYRDFLKNIMLLYSENVPLATEQIWLQSDEVVQHFWQKDYGHYNKNYLEDRKEEINQWYSWLRHPSETYNVCPICNGIVGQK